jgi:S1-C subfamily serine protease
MIFPRLSVKHVSAREICLLLLACLLVAAGQPDESLAQAPRARGVQRLRPGETVTAVVSIDEPSADFRFNIPDDAVQIELKIEGARADLDLYVNKNARVTFDEVPDFAADSLDFNETLRLTRWSGTNLESGRYFAQVTLGSIDAPRVGGRQISEFPFRLTYHVVTATSPTEMVTDIVLTERTSPENGFVRHYMIDVPEQTECLRVDLFQAESSLDLYLSPEPIVAPEGVELVLNGAESTKWVVIDANSDPPLRPGKYYLAVHDLFETRSGVGFSLVVGHSPAPPAAVAKLPPRRAAANPLERALFATVELLTADGGGSGVLVTPDGLILTNYHVMAQLDGNHAQDGAIIVALTLDPRLPPIDAYRAKVIDSRQDLDLALLQIEAGFYGQPLEATDVFPWIPLAESGVTIGDSLSVAGYPWIGGAGGRVSVTMTRGIVAGFDREGDASLIKTDAGVHAGHSGGPALNGHWHLIGMASETIEEELGAGKIGLIRPIEMLPEAWRKQIRERVAAAATP